MENLRIYGRAPFETAVIHGGPGAGGEMAPVARRLATRRGVLEPIQTATTLEGQVEELRAVLEEGGDPPVNLIGYSWGAWLSFIVAARHPSLVRTLMLVGSGPFEERYTDRLRETRLSRLIDEDRGEFEAIVAALVGGAAANRSEAQKQGQDALLGRLSQLASMTDVYDPVGADEDESEASDLIGLDGALYQGVWTEAAEMRRSGELLRLAADVRCPVVAIHGDYDPHPAAGVEAPLSASLSDFRFALLERCGHTPWLERQARDGFYEILEAELHGRGSHSVEE